MNKDQHVEFLLRLGDNALVLGHRLSEWCGHAPVLEEDIAMTNVALDLIGQARLLYSHAGAVEGKGRDEDAIAYLRDVLDWRNCLLVEQPNGDFADTMARQFLFDVWNFEVFSALTKSADEQLAAIAAKALKEVSYHRRHSGDWVIRLGGGTEESRSRMVAALDRVWGFTDEMFQMDETDRAALQAGIGLDLEALRPAWEAYVGAVLAEAGLEKPAVTWSVKGGRTKGHHSEHLGYLLAELQFMQRAYPNSTW
ncbi:1,2-phenylacetyl-CoA epoxidase subunit PaaC [Hwanghaeella sp.]|uniref:1,2-phenylacetyl-CoA epoxidase subunit PaaC n=1 Tax=Hwanghaeella sp. TaxID=2605943 RepID=UPI003CCBFA78